MQASSSAGAGRTHHKSGQVGERVGLGSRRKDANIHAPECVVWCRNHLFAPDEFNPALTLGSALYPERWPIAPGALLGEQILGNPAGEQATAQLADAGG